MAQCSLFVLKVPLNNNKPITYEAYCFSLNPVDVYFAHCDFDPLNDRRILLVFN